jgi:hypothetical protein
MDCVRCGRNAKCRALKRGMGWGGMLGRDGMGGVMSGPSSAVVWAVM